MKLKILDKSVYDYLIYTLWYNTLRKNRGKGKKSPVEILKGNGFKNAMKIAMFRPIIVDNYMKDITLIKEGGHLKMRASIFYAKKVLTRKAV